MTGQPPRPFSLGALPAMRAPDIDGMVQAAMAAMRAEDFPRCAAIAEQVTRIDAKRVEAWLLLCAALTKMEAVDAERAMADAMRHVPWEDPAFLILQVDRARALAAAGRHQEAVDLVEAAERRPDIPPRQRDVVGAVYAMVNLFDRAAPHCAAAAAAMPNDPITHYNLGSTLRYLGRFDEAEAAFERTLALDPDHSLAHLTLAQFVPARERNHIDRLRAALGRASDDHVRARLLYALHRELHELRRLDEAWGALAEGAAIARSLWPFRPEQKRSRTQALMETFSAGYVRATDSAPRPGPKPIFIVGLPRSGTTLTERVLAGHSRVTAMGETSGFMLALRQTLQLAPKQELDARAIQMLAAADWPAVGARYLANTTYLNAGADVITEKLPHNYEWVGAITRAFPDAPIVHLRRGPMDSLFGAFKVLFGDDSYPWSYSLADLAENYRQYRRLMDHWRTALGPRFVEVTLEQLIADPDAQIRQLLDACGLAFEPACLSPHEVEGGVSTASSAQVRRPINRQGVGAWRTYAAQLEPLRAELERDGFVDSRGEPIWD